MSEPKRYLLFAGRHGVMGGGWDDLKDAFHTLNRAKQVAESLVDRQSGFPPCDWAQIVDVETWSVVDRS